MQRAVSEIDPTGNPLQCSLALCLSFCLGDAERHSSPSADFLRAAIGELEQGLPDGRPARGGAVTEMNALICYLEYLLPELEARSTDAARFVRDAVSLLRRSVKGGPAPRLPATLH